MISSFTKSFTWYIIWMSSFLSLFSTTFPFHYYVLLQYWHSWYTRLLHKSSWHQKLILTNICLVSCNFNACMIPPLTMHSEAQTHVTIVRKLLRAGQTDDCIKVNMGVKQRHAASPTPQFSLLCLPFPLLNCYQQNKIVLQQLVKSHHYTRISHPFIGISHLQSTLTKAFCYHVIASSCIDLQQLSPELPWAQAAIGASCPH